MAEHALTQYPLPEYPQCTLGMCCGHRLMGENEHSTERAPGGQQKQAGRQPRSRRGPWAPRGRTKGRSERTKANPMFG